MNTIDQLLRQNLEIEGVLRVIKNNPREDAYQLLKELTDKFVANVRSLDDKPSAIGQVADVVVDMETSIATDASVGDDEQIHDSVADVLDEKEEISMDEPVSVFQPPVFEKVSDYADNTDEDIEHTAVDFRTQTTVDETHDNDPQWKDTVIYEETTLVATDQDYPDDYCSKPDTTDVTTEYRNIPDESVGQPTPATATQPSVNAQSLASAFTINDRFRYIREIFDNSDKKFNFTINLLSNMDSLQDAFDYLLNELELDYDDDNVKDFLNVISSHFTSR